MNPFIKSLLTALAATTLPVLDAAVQSVHPTGGAAQALNSNTAYADLYAIGLIVAHNVLTSLENAAGVTTSSSTK